MRVPTHNINFADCIVNVIENGGTCRYSFVEDDGLVEHLIRSIKKSYIIGFVDQKLRAKYRKLMEENGAGSKRNEIFMGQNDRCKEKKQYICGLCV